LGSFNRDISKSFGSIEDKYIPALIVEHEPSEIINSINKK
jgi:hypothetical protein